MHNIIHLSDMHFQPEISNNPILDRVESICRAIIANTSATDQNVLVLSGDIANMGQVSEYEACIQFISALHNGLQPYLSNSIQCVIVPGNHDCVLPEQDSVRELILDSIRQGKGMDAKITKACLEPQRNFCDFVKKMEGILPSYSPSEMYSVIPLDHLNLCFALLNTASQCERRDTAGHFVFPVEKLSNLLPAIDKRHFVAVLHHPYNWMEPNCGRALKQVLERSASVILTGHEHINDTYLCEHQPQEQNLYVEGGVLQEIGDPNSSSFNLVRLDVEKSEFHVQIMRWDGTKYTNQKDAPIQQIIKNRTLLTHRFPTTVDMNKILDDPGMAFTHARAPRGVNLSDLYIPRDFNKIEQNKDQQPVGLLKGKQLLNYVLTNKHVLITCSEKGGKTTLAKRLFVDFQNAGKVPLLVSEMQVTTEGHKKIEKQVASFVEQQYGSNAVEGYWQLFPTERALIIDGYDQLGKNSYARDLMIRAFEERYEIIVIICNDDIIISDFASQGSKVKTLWQYNRIDMLEVGHVGRYELVKKWVSLGRDLSDDEDTVYRETVHLDHLVSTILVRNLLPSQPYLILMLLQQLEAGTPSITTSGSYGHLFEFIIKARLLRISRDNAELEGYLTYLSEIAYKLYLENVDNVPESTFQTWHYQYCESYARNLEYDTQLKKLIKEQIVAQKYGQISFRYRYYRCFFLARYIANHIDDDAEARALVEKFAENLHLSDNGDVMMFLCHVSKNRCVVQSIMSVAQKLFADAPSYDLTITPLFGIDDKIGHPRLALTDAPPEENRRRLLEASDDAERGENSPEEKKTSNTITLQVKGTDSKDYIDLAVQFNSAFKTVQIIGQIVRNFYGSLKAEEQKELIHTSYALGLRILGRIFNLLSDTEGLKEQFSAILKTRYPNMSEADENEQISRFTYSLSLGIAIGVVKHISNSVGLAQLNITFDRIMRDIPNQSYSIIDLSVRLDHFDQYPLTELLKVMKSVHNKYFAMGLIRFLVWHHFFLFPEDYRLVQKVCSELKIELPPDKFLNPLTKKQ